jgi:hypothetical protein
MINETLAEDAAYASVVDGMERFLRSHPGLCQECLALMAEPSLSAVGRAAGRVSAAMDATNWIRPSTIHQREFCLAVDEALKRIEPDYPVYRDE